MCPIANLTFVLIMMFYAMDVPIAFEFGAHFVLEAIHKMTSENPLPPMMSTSFCHFLLYVPRQLPNLSKPVE